ncbi:MAG: hypothetical protein AAB848_01205 [Patescibacteria group bacterium]
MGGETSPKRPPEDVVRQGERPVEARVEAPVKAAQSPAREKEGEKAAKELISDNLGAELKWVKDRVDTAFGKIESAYNHQNFDALSQRARFAEGLLIRALKLPIVGIKKRWVQSLEELGQKGWDKKQVNALRDQYAHEGNGEIAEVVKIAEAYIRKMREKTEGRGTPAVLAEMTRSIGRNAEIYAALLAEGGNKDLVDAVKAVLGIQVEGKTSAASLEKAKKTIEARLGEEFPNGKLMGVIWMIMSFLDRGKKLEIANYFKQKHPGEIGKFLEAGNLHGVFDPDGMEQILGKKYDAGKRTEFAIKWQAQNDFSKEGKTMLGTSYGSENPVNTMLSGKGLLFFAGQLAAGLTIGANLLATTFVSIKGKGPLGGIMAIPDALLNTIKNPNVIGAGVVLGGIHLAKSPKTLDEMLMPKAEGDNLTRSQGKEALRVARRGNPLWDKWNELFMSDNFMGGKVFADFVRHQKLKAGDENLEEAKLTMKDFLGYIEEQSQSKNPIQRGADYAALGRSVENALKGEDNSQVFTLAKAFDHLDIGGATGKANYEKYLKEIEKA